MKNRLLIVFSGVFVINIILDFFLYKYNGVELGLETSIILLIGSYITYWLLNLYIYFLKSNKQNTNYSFLCSIGGIVCFIVLFVLLINLKNDLIIFFPIMYVVSILSSFWSWIISDKKERKSICLTLIEEDQVFLFLIKSRLVMRRL